MASLNRRSIEGGQVLFNLVEAHHGDGHGVDFAASENPLQSLRIGGRRVDFSTIRATGTGFHGDCRQTIFSGPVELCLEGLLVPVAGAAGVHVDVGAFMIIRNHDDVVEQFLICGPEKLYLARVSGESASPDDAFFLLAGEKFHDGLMVDDLGGFGTVDEKDIEIVGAERF